jgi:hypothetical protein
VLAISHWLVLPSAFSYGVGTLIFENYAAQYPTRMYPCQRFACSLATDLPFQGAGRPIKQAVIYFTPWAFTGCRACEPECKTCW